MPPLEKHKIVCQVPGGPPWTVQPYTGTDLSQALAVNVFGPMQPAHYGWLQTTGELLVMVGSQTQAAFADFEPNAAKIELSVQSTDGIPASDSRPPGGQESVESLAFARTRRLSSLQPLLMEVGHYCSLLREARAVFVDGHFYACVAMCGISIERFQRDKARPYGATKKHKIWQVRQMLEKHKSLKPESFELCRKMADLRNDYAHGDGLNPDQDALKALEWVHALIDRETALMRDYEIANGTLHRRSPNTSKAT